MTSLIRLVLILLVGLVATASPHAAERSGKKAFQDAWTGRSVVIKRVLYSVVFDEHSRVLPLITHRDRVTGLTVVTPTGGSYLQFDARRESEKDIVAQDPNQILSELRQQYIRDSYFDCGSVQDVEALKVVRYSPGVAFIVKKVQIDRDRVRLYFHKNRDADLATTLTVKFPVPFSKDLEESELIDHALTLFVTRE